MYLIDVRRRNKELIDLAREARDKFDITLGDFYRLAVINAISIEVTPISHKQEHYSTDMSKIFYLNSEIKNVNKHLSQLEYRGLCALIGVAGSKIRKNLPYFEADNIDVSRLRVAPDFLRGLIYAREI